MDGGVPKGGWVMGKHGIALTPADMAVLDQQEKAEYLQVRTRCLELGLSQLTFNRMVTDLTIHGIGSWGHRIEAAKKIHQVCREVAGSSNNVGG